MGEDNGSLDGILFRNILKESIINDIYGDVGSQDNSSCAFNKNWDIAKDGGQKDHKNIIYDDAVDGDKNKDLNEDGLYLRNGLGENINNGNNKHNYIEQGGVINQQDGQGNHFGGAINNPQAHNEHFGGVNELDQNNAINNNNDDDNNDDNNDEGQNQGENNNNHVEVSENKASCNDPNINDDDLDDNQQHNYDSTGD